MMAVNIKNKSV